MRYLSSLVLMLTLLWTSSSVGQNNPKTEPAKSNHEVEVKFGDSSTVRMLVLQESVEIVTKFGKLLVRHFGR